MLGLVAKSLCLLWSPWSVLVGHWHTTVLQQCVFGFGQPQVALQSVFHYQKLLLLFLFLVFYSFWRKVLQYFAIPQTEEFHTVACLSLPVRSRIDCSRFLHPWVCLPFVTSLPFSDFYGILWGLDSGAAKSCCSIRSFLLLQRQFAGLDSNNEWRLMMLEGWWLHSSSISPSLVGAIAVVTSMWVFISTAMIGIDHTFFWIALSRQVHGLLLDVHSERCVILYLDVLGCILSVVVWMCIVGMSLFSHFFSFSFYFLLFEGLSWLIWLHLIGLC